MTNVPPQRVSAISAPAAYLLPGRPEGAAAATQDAYRQTQFLLGGDLDLFAAAMNLQLALLQDAHPSRYRTHSLAAIVALWSRAYLYLADAALLTSCGAYASTLPLVRAACEAIGAEEGLRGGEMDEHNLWLANTLKPSEAFKAFEFDLGRYYAGDVIAADPVLRPVFRAATDLARPNFGASLIQVAPESNNNRLAIAFGDTSFHLGWAEIVLGWLMALAGRQLGLVLAAEGVFPVTDERRNACADQRSRIEAALARPDRAAIQEVEDGNDRRYLIVNFRRTSGGAPKKILL